MGFVHFKILIFPTFQVLGKGLEKEYPLQVANISMLLVENCLPYIHIMTFENILGVFFFSRQECFKEL